MARWPLPTKIRPENLYGHIAEINIIILKEDQRFYILKEDQRIYIDISPRYIVKEDQRFNVLI